MPAKKKKTSSAKTKKTALSKNTQKKTVKKSAPKTAAKKTSVKKAAPKKVAKKTVKSVPKKASVKKTAPKKAAKKTVPKKAAPKLVAVPDSITKPAAKKTLKKMGLLKQFFADVRDFFKFKLSAKKAVSTWALLTVIIAFSMAIYKFFKLYTAGYYYRIPIFNVLVDEVLISGFKYSLLIFVPIFAAILLYRVTKKIRNNKRPQLVLRAFKIKSMISAFISLIFTLIVYLDASNILGRNMGHIFLCETIATDEICYMSFNMLSLISQVFVIVFAGVLTIQLVLFGFYQGISPIIENDK